MDNYQFHETDCNLRILLVTQFEARLDIPSLLVASSYDEAMTQLKPDLDALITEACIGGQICSDLLYAAKALNPSIYLSAFGPVHSASHLHKLRHEGIRLYIEATGQDVLHKLIDTVAETLALGRCLETLGRRLVGNLGLKDAQDALRRAMVVEAYVRSGSNKGATGRLLGITRPAVQKIVRNLLPEDFAAHSDECASVMRVRLARMLSDSDRLGRGGCRGRGRMIPCGYGEVE